MSAQCQVKTLHQSTNQDNVRRRCLCGKDEACFLIGSVLVVDVWSVQESWVLQCQQWLQLSERVQCSQSCPCPWRMLFGVAMLKQEPLTGHCRVAHRCCFPGTLFLDIPKQCWHQNQSVPVFAFWIILVAWSFWHVFPCQIDFSGSPTYTAVWSQATSPGYMRGYISQKYFFPEYF